MPPEKTFQRQTIPDEITKENPVARIVRRIRVESNQQQRATFLRRQALHFLTVVYTDSNHGLYECMKRIEAQLKAK